MSPSRHTCQPAPPMIRLTLTATALWIASYAGLLTYTGTLRAEDDVVADPAAIQLTKPWQRHSILAHGRDAHGRLFDLTRQATFRSLTPGIVSVSETGVTRGLADGAGRVEVAAHGKTRIVEVSVTNATAPRRFNFENDIVPLLSRHGCNSSGCHGKAEGQNGFKLSVFGFDPRADYDALAKESRGRRVFPAAPDRSLLLRKISGADPHGGGVRITRGTRAYETLQGWIAAGLPQGDDSDPRVVSIELTPRERVMAMNAAQQLRVVATYSDGSAEDVTALAKFQSNNDSLVSVDEAGLVSAGQTPGQAAVMASYMGAVDVFQTLIPRQEFAGDYPELPERNFIDHFVNRKLQKLNILPSDLADDATYLRRVYLDVIGTVPTVAEARSFLDDNRPDKRRRLVDALLERPEFADYSALYWSDLLRVDRQTLGHKAAYAYYAWIRESLAKNKPLDEFALDVLTAEGTLQDCPPTAFYQVEKRPGDMASTFSQVFLGVRIACAVPSSSLRPLESAGLLRHAGHVRASPA